ncbi:MAG: hypothetical protein ORN28_10175 [Rhodoferax sp.]|nr:hypothetical protein [Rhodoferax sp.]
MNIAMVLQHRLVMGLQFLMAGAASLATSPYTSRHAGQQPHSQGSKNVPGSAGALRATPTHSATYSASTSYKRALTPFGTCPQTRQQHKAMPLRVLRVDDDPAGENTGRLRISGRMADVCAELDRLAAKEAAMH